MKQLKQLAVLFVPLALTSCQKFDASTLNCEEQSFVSKSGYYSCCKARELHFIRRELERAVEFDKCDSDVLN